MMMHVCLKLMLTVLYFSCWIAHICMVAKCKTLSTLNNEYHCSISLFRGIIVCSSFTEDVVSKIIIKIPDEK
jgi:hypothetical protein